MKNIDIEGKSITKSIKNVNNYNRNRKIVGVLLNLPILIIMMGIIFTSGLDKLIPGLSIICLGAIGVNITSHKIMKKQLKNAKKTIEETVNHLEENEVKVNTESLTNSNIITKNVKKTKTEYNNIYFLDNEQQIKILKEIKSKLEGKKINDLNLLEQKEHKFLEQIELGRQKNKLKTKGGK